MTKRAQLGSGLIESMVSIFVVSIGFLGFAGLQVNGLASANDSLFRSKAIYLSYQMADRVRANLPAVQARSYNALSRTTTTPRSIPTGCTPAPMAHDDVSQRPTRVGPVL